MNLNCFARDPSLLTSAPTILKHALSALGALCSSLLLISTVAALEPVRLSPYPQKVRTFFSLSDTNVPAGLRTNAVPLPAGGITASARASDGAIWLGTTQGLVRLDSSAPARDRQQYLAGLRYLPDDHVQQLLPDAQGGVWVAIQ